MLLGWAFGVAWLTTVLPGFVSMKPDTALCFVLAGSALALAAWPTPLSALAARVCGSGVFSIAFLTLVQHLAGLDFAIDERMALATSVGFCAAGVALIVLPGASRASWLGTSASAASIATGAVGGLGLAGYLLNFELLYASYSYGTVALHTAAGFVALGAGLWFAAAQARRVAGEETTIARRATGLVVFAAAAVGLASLIGIIHLVELVLAKGLDTTLYARSAQISDALALRELRAANLATSPDLLRQLRLLANQPRNSELRARIRDGVLGLGARGFSAVVLTGRDGAELARFGASIESPGAEPRASVAGASSLVWHDGLHVRHALALVDAEGPLGSVLADQFMPETTDGLLRRVEAFGETSELLLCAPATGGFGCFPTHLTPQPSTLVTGSGDLASCAQRARDGQRGFARGTNRHGRRVFAGYAPLGPHGLVALLTVETAEIYLPLGRQFEQVLLLVGGISLAGHFLVRRWVRPQVALLERRVRARTAELAEANVQASRNERRFRATIDSAPTAMVMIDADGAIVLVNDQTERLFGYAREELLGRPVENLLPQRFRVGHPELRTAFFAAPRARQMGAGRDLYGLCKDGSEIPVEIGLSPVETEEGLLVLSAIVDISERMRQIAAVDRANEVLETNIELQRFAYVVSHDLQTPMRSIASFVELLRATYADKLDAQANDWIRRTVDSIKYLQTLIRDLLEYSRADALARPSEPVSLSAVFDHAVSLLDAPIRESGAAVTRGELPIVNGDRSQLVQLLLNLIGNALKYHGADPPRVHVSAEHKDDGWTFAVRDNGIGIAPRHHERIFGIFKRLHDQKEYAGTGIGLAICRRVAHHHGGRIWVESDGRSGSVFYFSIAEGTVEVP